MQLHTTFASRYASLRSVKVVTDPNTGLSKKYGFVRFRSEDDCNRALQEMQGQYLGKKYVPSLNRTGACPYNLLRPLRMNFANQKKTEEGPVTMDEGSAENDPNNTCLFVGGLDVNTTEDEVRAHFQRFGELTYIKLPTGKPYAFLSFTTKESARAAFETHGTPIGRNRIRVSWGKLNFNGASSTQRDTPSVPSQSPTALSVTNCGLGTATLRMTIALDLTSIVQNTTRPQATSRAIWCPKSSSTTFTRALPTSVMHQTSPLPTRRTSLTSHP
jgi:RNA recognition motif-containing protein